MNVVGKVGSLISQGVYSVATPFHPFGGAVDVIVVQHQDGTFRSTPWYVRFGKFQGVLKGAEKIVHITVNGIEANFHMYLDNSGEAYFVREVDLGDSETSGCGKDSDNLDVIGEDDSLDNGNNAICSEAIIDIRKLEHSVSDSRVVQLRDACDSSVANRIERVESDVGQKFYEFQDEQTSLEDSIELSEYGSNRYENLDTENFEESQGSDSEVILVSVDGQVLTAPISVSEKNTEDVQLSTAQFHLGPGEGTDYCEGNENFSSGENPWAADCIRKLDVSTDNIVSNNVSSMSNDSNSIAHEQEVCEGDREHVCQAQETQNIVYEEGNMHLHNEVLGNINKKEDVEGCLKLQEFDKLVGNADLEDTGSQLGVQNSQEMSSGSLPAVDDSENGVVVELKNNDGLSLSHSSNSPPNNASPNLPVEVKQTEENVSGTEHKGSDSVSVNSVCNNPEGKDEHFGTSAASEGMDYWKFVPEEQCKNEIVEPQIATLSKEMQTYSSISFEVSLCGNELRPGMGLSAAAEAFDAHRISAEEFKSTAASIIKNEKLIIKFRERYLPWEKAAPIVLGIAAFGLDFPVEPKDAIPVEQSDMLPSNNDDSGITSTPSGRIWRLWPIPFRRVKTLEHTSSNASSEDVFVDSESDVQKSLIEPTPVTQDGNEPPHKQLVRTNIPTNEQIASLNLKEGQNMITFSFATRVLGKQQVDAHIYLWMWNARIVISDVDGTITKSDVLGQFMPLVGKDWTQSGVARLFSAIKENGYQLLFLSARAIVQAYLTRSFLLNLKQDGKALPSGPIVISPDGLFPSLFREVIRRAPHEFKIACLEDIKRLFPSDYNPFYAGFGNRDTDELSYRKIGIPKGKIFIINPKGEVAISHRIDVKSYTSLHTLVNDMFPPTSFVEQEDYNSWNFWRMPVPDIEG